MAQDLDLSAFQAVVDSALGACPHQTFDLHAKLIAQAFRGLEHLGTVWITNHLHIAFAVAQVHKNHAAMVAAAVDPSAQGNGLAHEGFGYKTAIVRAHCHGVLSIPLRGSEVGV